jgi:nucleoside-diphosphate-sugar epimerase
MTHILVTGATGQLGRRVVSDLIASNYDVTAVSSNAGRLSKIHPLSDKAKLNLLACNLVDADAVSRSASAVNHINVIVHLASGLPADPYDHATCTEQVIMSINLIGNFGNQIDYAIIGSCTSVYGGPTVTNVDEDHPTYPNTYHGSSQLASEKFWNIFSVNSGKPVTCLRFAPLVARNVDHASTLTGKLTLADASRALLSALRTRKTGVFNIYPEIAKR